MTSNITVIIVAFFYIKCGSGVMVLNTLGSGPLARVIVSCS